MIRTVYFFLLVLATFNLFAQAPNDCSNAVIVCGNGNLVQMLRVLVTFKKWRAVGASNTILFG